MSTIALAALDPKYLAASDLRALSAQFRQYPLLDKIEEAALAEAYYHHHDQAAAQKLVLANMRYVIRIAKGFMGYGLPAQDLVQEGCIGLMKSIKHFDPYKGVRLLTYSTYWIKAEMQEYIIRNWRLVKIATTKAQRKLFFKLRSLKQKIQWLSAEEVSATAQTLAVPEGEVRHMEQRLAQDEQSLAFDNPDEPSNIALQLVDPQSGPDQATSQNQLHQLFRDRLTDALGALDDRERAIIQARWLNENKAPLKVLAERLEVSIERVRQIERAAMNKMKTSFDSEYGFSLWLELDT